MLNIQICLVQNVGWPDGGQIKHHIRFKWCPWSAKPGDTMRVNRGCCQEKHRSASFVARVSTLDLYDV